MCWKGGVSSPTLPWVLTIPLLACFYLGSSPALRRTVPILFAANVAAYFGLQVLGLSATSAMPAAALQGLGIVSTSAAALYVAMMASYYAKVLASGVELEAAARQHLATAVELRRAAAEAERADAAKAEFLAKMSHELRTPLNAVIGYSQILLEDAEAEGDTATVEDLNKIHGAGQHLLKIVNAVLDLSKIEAGKMELFVETVDFAALVRSAAERCRKRAAGNGTGLSLELDGCLGLVRCDAHKTEQSLFHIIDNAAKFTHGGSILVTATRRHGASGDEVAVAVRDTGIGIPEDALPGLFRQFDGVEDATSSKYGGTGVGLALSQKLCRLMGGDILVESQHGVGSCFTVRLPVGGASPEPEEARDARDGSGERPALAWAA